MSGRNSCRSAAGNLVHWKSFYLCGCGICAGAFVRRISYGEERLPLCEHHARHHRAHPAFKRRLDHCAPPLLRSLGWNRRRPGAGRCVAGAPRQAGEGKRRVDCIRTGHGCLFTASILPYFPSSRAPKALSHSQLLMTAAAVALSKYGARTLLSRHGQPAGRLLRVK